MDNLRQIWANRKKIFEGIKNKAIKDAFVEEVYKKRMAICKVCPHFDEEGTECAMPGTQPCCGACGCSLGWKARSLASWCGDETNVRWKAAISVKQENELIEKYGESTGETN
jgi:hypothetical protein